MYLLQQHHLQQIHQSLGIVPYLCIHIIVTPFGGFVCLAVHVMVVYFTSHCHLFQFFELMVSSLLVPQMEKKQQWETKLLILMLAPSGSVLTIVFFFIPFDFMSNKKRCMLSMRRYTTKVFCTHTPITHHNIYLLRETGRVAVALILFISF